MISKRNITLFYIVGILFALIDAWFILKHNNYFVSLIPIALIIVYMALFALDKLMLAVVFFTPISLNFNEIPGLHLGQIGVGVALPTEPIMFGIMIIFILRLAYEGLHKEVSRHPVTIAITASLLWMMFTAITSTMPFVSFKYLIERSWGVTTFFFFGVYLFKEKKNITSFLWLYVSAFVVVIIYTILRHAHAGFTEKAAHTAVNPFYNDHTAYGALLAMFIPILVGLCFLKPKNKTYTFISVSITLLYILAVGLSYSRAAWVSLVACLAMFIFMWLRIPIKVLLILIVVALIGIFAFQDKILLKLNKNNSEVSQDISTEIQSISNISSDASNRERINRWSCALRMFKDRPFLGFGPGTYMFKYAPYQLSTQRTIISTNLGIGGNAHSEYLGPLAEQGVFGMLAFMGIMVTVVILAFKLYYNLKDRELKILVISIFSGLITYFVHGAMNNFLDTDKAAVPFWGFIAMLVAIDIYYLRKQGEEPATSVSGTPAA